MEFFRLIGLLTWGEPDKSGIMARIVPDYSTFGKHNDSRSILFELEKSCAGILKRNAVLVCLNASLRVGSTIRKNGSILRFRRNPNQESYLQMKITMKLQIVVLAALSLGI